MSGSGPRFDQTALARGGAIGSTTRIRAAMLAPMICAMLVACSGGEGTVPAPHEGEAATEPVATAAAVHSTEIILFFPGLDDDLLHPEPRSVVSVGPPEDRARQCLSELARGPSPGLLAALPDGAEVREIYVLHDGTAWVDFSPGILRSGGGSVRELQTIYAIVSTLTMNVPEISRVGLLVNGRTRDTLWGHVDSSRPFSPNPRYVAHPGSPDEETLGPAAPAGTDPSETGDEGATDGAGATEGATGTDTEREAATG